MNDGYEQDVHNLAFHIIEYADRDFEQFRDEFADTSSQMLEYLADNPELKCDWDSLEEMADVMAKMYEVEYQDLMSDVWKAMLSIDPRTPKTWN